MLPDVDRKNQRIGMGVSIGVHGLILLLFFLIMAWREPDPPVPEYGIELNFGLDAMGSGEVQPEQPAPLPQVMEEQVVEETQTMEEPAEEPPVEEELPIREEQIIRETPVIQDSEMEDSPDVIEPTESKPEPVTEVEERETTTETPPVAQTEEQEVVEEQPVARNDARETTEQAQGAIDERVGDAEADSQGDDADVEGDKGDPKGAVDSRALYGTYGGGGGPLLELTGWLWDFEPNPNDTSNENGKIVFEIKIDDKGEIISVRTLEKTVSPAVERIYRSEVESLTFSPIASNTRPAPVSTGKITFIIRSK